MLLTFFIYLDKERPECLSERLLSLNTIKALRSDSRGLHVKL